MCGIIISSYLYDSWLILFEKVCDYLKDILDFDCVGVSFISYEVDDFVCLCVVELKL